MTVLNKMALEASVARQKAKPPIKNPKPMVTPDMGESNLTEAEYKMLVAMRAPQTTE
jgi:hypothetical protein